MLLRVAYLLAGLLPALAGTALGQDARPPNPAPDSLAGVTVLTGDSLALTPDGLQRVRQRIATLRSNGVVRQVIYPIIILVPTAPGAQPVLPAAAQPLIDTLLVRDTTRQITRLPDDVPAAYDRPVTYRDSVVYRNRVRYLGPVVFQDTVVYRDSVVVRQDLLPPTPVPVVVDTTAPPPPEAVETVEAAVAETVVGTGLLGTLTVVFPLNESTLLPSLAPTLNTLGALMERFPSLRIEITGHTDDTGPAAYNQRLSEARAEATRRYLLDHFAIDPDRLTARGRGESDPAASNAHPTGRTLNRRVTFTVVDY